MGRHSEGMVSLPCRHGGLIPLNGEFGLSASHPTVSLLVIAGLRLARERQVNMRVIPTRTAIEEPI